MISPMRVDLAAKSRPTHRDNPADLPSYYRVKATELEKANDIRTTPFYLIPQIHFWAADSTIRDRFVPMRVC